MLEKQIPKIEKEDIVAPPLEAGQTAIVLQRHERYDRDRNADTAGSLDESAAEAAYLRDLKFFEQVLDDDNSDAETMILFISSDTQYAGKGHRSMETAQLAQDAAIETLESRGIDAKERIINLNDRFSTKKFNKTDQAIRPDKKIHEPEIFDVPEYVDFLRDKYGKEDGPGNGISQEAWAVHEMDGEREKREELGAEGVHDVVDRTKQSLAIVERYAKMFHALNPNKKLVVWMASHYDTISPLMKDATDTGFDEYVPVDYGAGVVITLSPESEPQLKTRRETVALQLGKSSIDSVR